MKSRSIAAWLSLPILLVAFAAGAQTIPVEFEVGIRWTDIEGNQDLYRTQVNERAGFVVRNLTFFTSDFDGPERSIVDHFRVDASELSVGPSSAIRLDAGKSGAYRVRAGFRRFEMFSALPNFANPMIDQGIVPGQHTWNRDRTMFDADVEILAFGEKFVPFVGYGYSTLDGPGTTTYYLGTDEFKLDNDIKETERELRVGAGFNLGKFYGSVTQGWRDIEAEERLNLSAGAGNGNNSFPILDNRQITAAGITRFGKTEGESPFTNLNVAGQPMSRLQLTASFAMFDADVDSIDDELSNGTFVSFPLRRYFNRLDEYTTSTAKNESWRGNFRAEYEVSPRINLMAGYRKEDRELSGTALIDSLFIDTITFGGGEPGNVQELVEAESSLDRQLDELELGASFRIFQSLVFRLGVTQADYDVEMTPALEEISVPGNQGGVFERSVNSVDASATWADDMFGFSAAYRREDADDPIFRTDFVDRNRWRARASFTSPERVFRFGLSAQETDQDGENQQIGLDANSREYTLDAELAPWETFRIRGAYSQVRLDSEISYRRPETFALGISRHEEDWGAMELGFAMIGNLVSFDASAARLENEGSIPYVALRYRARATWDFRKNVGLIGEWARDQYDEENASWGYFQGDRFGVFFRYRP